MDLKILINHLEQTPNKKIRKLEEVLPRLSQHMFFDSGANNRLSEFTRKILKKRGQTYLDEFGYKNRICIAEELERNRKIIESIDQASINLIAYRLENIKELFEKLSKNMHDKTSKEIHRSLKVPYFHPRFRVYFSLYDYHDRFAYEICNAIKREDIDTLNHLLDKGLEHIVWTNVCESSLRYINQFTPKRKFKKIHLPNYPQEFFDLLIVLEYNLPFLEEVERGGIINLRNEFFNQTLEDVIIAGRYNRVGKHPFNEQKLRNKCLEYLNSFPSTTARLIKDYYLDRQIEIYQANLSGLKTLVTSYLFKKRLEKLKLKIDSVIKSLPTRKRSELWWRWEELHDKLSIPQFPKSKREMSGIYSIYWSLVRRKSLNYTAATILLECICHIQHDFPVDRWIETKYLQDDIIEFYTIQEIPTDKSYKEIAHKLGLSPKNLKEYHEGTMLVCRMMPKINI